MKLAKTKMPVYAIQACLTALALFCAYALPEPWSRAIADATMLCMCIFTVYALVHL